MKCIIFILFFVLLPLISTSQELRIFTFYPIEYDSLQKGAFISLSDENIWTEETMETRSAIYKNESEIDDESQELSGNRRTAFLKDVRINDSESIFIYNMFLDSIFTFQVNEITLIEKPNTYSGTDIGFKITELELELMGAFYWNTFVFIGNDNQFQTGEIHPMTWNKVAQSNFPKDIQASNHEEWYDSSIDGETFSFITDELTFLVQNLSSKGGIEGRHLIVSENQSKEIVFNEAIINREGPAISSLIAEYENNQWTGKIFKDKPTMIYGFEWVSFSCQNIDFI